MDDGSEVSLWVEPSASIAGIWERYEPPARPSPGELTRYSDLLGEISTANRAVEALLLGSTPELQDLLTFHQFKCECLDLSRENYRLMKRLRESVSPTTFLEGSWERFSGRSFELIIGDTCLNLLPWTMWKSTLSNLRRLLNRKGVLIHRFYTVQKCNFFDEDPRAKLETITKTAAERGRENGLNFYQSTIFEFYRVLTNIEDYRFEFSKWMETLDDLLVSGTVSPEELASVEYLRLQSEMGFFLTIPPADEVQQLLQDLGFEVLAMVDGGEDFPFHRDCPILMLGIG